MKKITKSMLLSAGACFYHVDRFQDAYPKGIDVCWVCFREAMQREHPVHWLVKMTYPKLPYMKAIARRANFYKYCKDGGGKTIVSTKGLQWLEKILLRTKEPTRNSRRIAEYHAWRKRSGSPETFG